MMPKSTDCRMPLRYTNWEPYPRRSTVPSYMRRNSFEQVPKTEEERLLRSSFDRRIDPIDEESVWTKPFEERIVNFKSLRIESRANRQRTLSLKVALVVAVIFIVTGLRFNSPKLVYGGAFLGGVSLLGMIMGKCNKKENTTSFSYDLSDSDLPEARDE